MALINCKECGKEISDRASNCIYCGCPICKEEDSTGKFDNTGNHGDVSSRTRIRKTKLKFYQKSWFIILMLIVLFPVGLVLMWKNRKFHAAVRVILSVIWCAHFMFWSMMFIGLLLPCDHVWTEATASDPKTCLICGETEGEPLFYEEDTSGDDKTEASIDSYLNTNNENVKLELEAELETVENLFSLNYKEILSEYPNAEFEFPDKEDRYDLNIAENFAGLSGLYNVCISDDGTVWRVIFEPEDESLATRSVVDVISASLGDYIDYDSEYDYYTWRTDNLEIEYWIEDRTYIDWIGEDLDVNKITENNKHNYNETDSEESIPDSGVIENIYTTADIPDELMNNEFKDVVDLFSKGFSQSGLDITNATTYNNGETYIFYLDNLEFLGDECEDDYFQPRIIYSREAINNNGTPNKIFLAFANLLKSNGYKETVEMVEDIAQALGISDFGLINNDYSSSSKLAIGKYATFTFPNLGLELTVSNTDGTVEIEILPID